MAMVSTERLLGRVLVVRGVALAVALCGVLACVLGLGVAPASALEFGGEGEGAGEMNRPLGIAISPVNHEVYIADRSNQRVDVFSEAGQFLFAWGWDVDESAPAMELQTCTLVSECQAGAPGGGDGQMYEPEDVAVSSAGNVYVQDRNNARVDEFSASGQFVLSFGGKVNKNGSNVCRAGEECQAGVEGSAPGDLGDWPASRLDIASPAEGPGAGKVYVGEQEIVDVFSGEGQYESSSSIAMPAGTGRLEGLTVDDEGDVYVELEALLQGVRKFEDVGGTGVELGSARDEAGAVEGIAIGRSDGLLVQPTRPQHHLLEFAAAGTQLESFDADGPQEEAGIAWSETAQAVYAVDTAGEADVVRVVSEPPPGPVVVPGSVSAAPGALDSEVVSAGVEPEGAATEYSVEYGLTSAYGQVSGTSSLPASFAEDTVEVVLPGLEPGEEYHYCVAARNENTVEPPAPCSQPSEDHTFTTLLAVKIDAQWETDVSAQAATLSAELTSHSASSEYAFQYGSRTAYEAGGGFEHETAERSHLTPDGGTAVVSEHVQGLPAGSGIVWRVVLKSGGQTYEGALQSFSTPSGSGAGGLLDARSWEFVGGGITGAAIIPPSEGDYQAAQTGGGLTYDLRAPSEAGASSNRAPESTQVISRHAGSGWGTKDLAVPYQSGGETEFGQGPDYRFFSPDLSSSIVTPRGALPLSEENTPIAGEPPALRTPYVRSEAGGSVGYVPLVDRRAEYADAPASLSVEENPVTEPLNTEFEGANAKATSVALRGKLPLVEGAPADALYEWSAADAPSERLQLVSVLPEAEGGAPVKAALGGGNEPAEHGGVRGAVSEDGEMVVWTAGASGHLYVRDTGLGQTVRVDLVQSGSGEGTPAPVFNAATATASGERVFFTDTQALLEGAHSGEGAAGARDLYECEVTVLAGRLQCALTDLTSDTASAKESAGVQGEVAGVNEAGTTLYFVADGELARGAEPGDCGHLFPISEPSTATCSLYEDRYEAGAWEMRFIATLSNEDEHDWGEPGETAGAPGLAQLTARSSPDGRYFAFMSDRSLTGYDNHDAVSGAPDEEAFLYDSQTERLVCVSCSPSGERPTGLLDQSHDAAGPPVDAAELWNDRWLAASLPSWRSIALTGDTYYQPRYLSDSGRLFFMSPVSLVPQDANGTSDVYEYEPPGAGDCTSTSSAYGAVKGGCLGLVSSGTSGEESVFIDASENGDDVFFMSTAGLAGQSDNSLYRVYDAHSCETGSSWSCAPENAAVNPPCTNTESCRGAPGPQPGVFGAPPSATFSGAGNGVPAASSTKPSVVRGKTVKCVKGKTRNKHGVCVKKAASKRAKKAKRARRASANRRAGR